MRILMSSLSYSAHIHPMLALGRAARSEGHEVTVATMPAAVPLVRSAGLEPFAMHPDVPVPPSLDDVETWGLQIIDARPRWAEQLAPYAEAWQPDVVVRDRCDSSGLTVATGMERRCVVYGVALRLPEETVLLSRQLQLGSAQVAEAAGPLASVDGDLWLSPYPRAFAYPGADPLPIERHVQPLMYGDTHGGEGLPDWLDRLDGRPLIYATFGTVFNRLPRIFEAVIEALADQDVNVVITVGRDRDPAEFGGTPGNVHVERFIPNSLLLPYCDAVITHGASTTVTAILANGLPMYLIPQGGDHPATARRCVDLGMGLSHPASGGDPGLPTVLPEELDPKRIREGVAEILRDPAYGEAARRMRDEIRALPDAEQTVAMIEDLVR